MGEASDFNNVFKSAPGPSENPQSPPASTRTRPSADTLRICVKRSCREFTAYTQQGFEAGTQGGIAVTFGVEPHRAFCNGLAQHKLEQEFFARWVHNVSEFGLAG